MYGTATTMPPMNPSTTAFQKNVVVHETPRTLKYAVLITAKKPSMTPASQSPKLNIE